MHSAKHALGVPYRLIGRVSRFIALPTPNSRSCDMPINSFRPQVRPTSARLQLNPTPLAVPPLLPTPSMQHLNEEQLKLLETKPLLEFALAEHERVRVAMETVAKDLKDLHAAELATEQAAEQAEQARLASLAPPSPTSPPPSLPAALSIAAPDNGQSSALSIPAGEPSVPALEADAQDSSPELDPAATAPAAAEAAAAMVAAAAAAAALSTRTVGVSTETPLTEELGAQTELSGPPPPAGLDPEEVSAAVLAAATLALEEKEKAAEEAEARGVAAGRAEAATGLSKILRLLHVASRFEAKGERLPTAVDFFSKVGWGAPSDRWLRL